MPTLHRHLALGGSLLLASLLGPLFGAAEPPPSSLPPIATARELWAYAAAERPEGRPALTDHRDVAGVLDAMLDGDAAVMFFDPPQFQTLPAEQFKSLRVTFAARNAQLKLVARLINRWLRHRVEFVPRTPDDQLTLTLQRVRLEDLLAALSDLGKVQVFEPLSGRPRGTSASAPRRGTNSPSVLSTDDGGKGEPVAQLQPCRNIRAPRSNPNP